MGNITHKWEDVPEHSNIKIITFDYEGKWTWEQFHTLHLQIIEEIEAQDIRVYPIINIGTNTYLPEAALSHLTRDPLIKHKNVVQVSMVINNLLIRTIAGIVMRIVQNKTIFVATLDDAHAAIMKDIESRRIEA